MNPAPPDPTPSPAPTPPVVSFVVPAYNEETRLARTLDGIIAEVTRTGCAAEIIVVNNASTDATAVIAAGFAARCAQVMVVDEPEKGLVAARRAGYRRSSGRLIANVDADTIVTEGWLSRVLAEFAADAALVALSGPYVYYDLSRSVRLAVRAFYAMGYLFTMLNRLVLRRGSMLQGGNFVVSRHGMEAIGGFNPRFTFYGEDTDLARRLSAVGTVKFSFALPALSSGRRLAQEGLLTIGLRYAMNFVWATFFHRPFTERHLDIRTEP